jgi:hypothetical protein
MRLLPKDSWIYAKAVEWDKKLAKLFGFSGDKTLSHECADSASAGCKCLCAVMNVVESNHCAKAKASAERSA